MVTNAGSWTLSEDMTFGSGSNSFVNEGRLILEYKGTAISLTGSRDVYASDRRSFAC